MNSLAVHYTTEEAKQKWCCQVHILMATWTNSELQSPVVQKVDYAIHRINLYTVGSTIVFPNTYLLDKGLSDG